MILPYYSLRNGYVYYLNKVKYLDLGSYIDLFDLMKIDKLLETVLIDYGVCIEKLPKIGHKNKNKILFIEPHPDDIALSCGGFFIKSREHYEIHVLTVFTRGSLSTFPWRRQINLAEKEYENLRILESKLAIEDFAKCNNIILRWPLALMRTHSDSYQEIDMNDLQIVEKLFNIIKKMFYENKYSIIIGPLGVGRHIDHLICSEAILKIRKELNVNIYLYEDMPYSLNKISYGSRMNELKKKYSLESFGDNISGLINKKAAFLSIYKSQFDDYTCSQIRGMMLSLGRAIASETKSEEITYDVAERLWMLK